MTYYFGGFASVVAVTGESTSVTVRAASALRPGAGVPAMNAGETRTFTLSPGDVLQLVGEGRGDITGTTIEASERVAVFVGHDARRQTRARCSPSAPRGTSWCAAPDRSSRCSS